MRLLCKLGGDQSGEAVQWAVEAPGHFAAAHPAAPGGRGDPILPHGGAPADARQPQHVPDRARARRRHLRFGPGGPPRPCRPHHPGRRDSPQLHPGDARPGRAAARRLGGEPELPDPHGQVVSGGRHELVAGRRGGRGAGASEPAHGELLDPSDSRPTENGAILDRGWDWLHSHGRCHCVGEATACHQMVSHRPLTYYLSSND